MSVLEKLNDKQREAAMQIEGPVLILAGAGSGKTRVLTNRTAYMIKEQGINPWNILAITFSNKAAGEMRERIDNMVGMGAESIWVATFHATCVRILRRHGSLIGYDSSFTIYDTDDQKSLMKDITKRLQIDSKQYSDKGFLNRISNAKNELLTPEEEAKDAMGDYGDTLYAKVYAEYQKSLKSNNAFDFDDLIMKTVELFRAYPEVLENYQDRFKYIMVDEYQDTNTAQFELVRLLAAKYRNICVVGDDDQSIYKFRGANIRNILDFEKVYPDAKVVKLEQNYRSTQNILNAANNVIANNKGRKVKSLWTDKGDGEKITFRKLDTAYEEADFIVSSIRHDFREGSGYYKNNAVLYRTNAQSRILEEKFIMAGIPYTVVGGVNFYSRREIKDILAYLKTIDNAKDDLAVKRILNVPKRGIGATTVGKISEYAIVHDINFYDALCDVEDVLGRGKAAEKILSFVDMIQVFRSKVEFLSIESLVKDILETIEYEQMLLSDNPDDAADRIENIQEFLNKVIAFEEAAEEKPSLSDFLEEVALVADIDMADKDADKVWLMTLHSAKGLEFPNVYLSGMEEGLFPSFMCMFSDDPAELEEERRLCYVGITRAMDTLTITSARSRMVRGETQYNDVSRFVKEIPTELFAGRVELGRPKNKVMYDGLPVSDIGRVVTGQSAGTRGITAKPYAYSGAKAKAAAARPFIAGAIKKGAQVTAGEVDYAVGDRVRHMKFGDGVVLDMKTGGRDIEVTVDFDTVGVKKMFAGFAKLAKI